MPTNYLSAFKGPNRAEIDRSAYSNSLLENEVKRMPARNRAEDLAIQADEQTMNRSRMDGARKMAADIFTAIADSPDPISTGSMLVQSQAFRDVGADLKLPVDQFRPGPGDDPEQIRAAARSWAQAVGGGANQQQNRVHSMVPLANGNAGYLTQDGQLVDTGQKMRESYQPIDVAGGIGLLGRGSGQVRPITTAEQETQAVADRKLAETEAVASVVPADARAAAAAKSPRLAAAARRLERVKAASQALGSGGGPVEGRLRNLVGTPAAQEMEAANAQLINELTALTRIPGVGSQSDLEQRLAQLALPNATQHPSVRARSIQELEAFLTDLGAALDSVSGQQPAASGVWTVTEIK